MGRGFRLTRNLIVAGAIAVALALGGAPAGAGSKSGPSTPSSVVLEVQTYNLYFGADLNPLFAPNANLLEAASKVYAEMQASRIPERARGAAELIAADRPDVVGLQEVSVWRSAPAEVVSGDVVPAGPFEIDYDALDLLLADLSDLGTPYQVVEANTNFSNEALPLPVVTQGALRLVAFTDSDVILVRSASLKRGRVNVGDTQSHTYEAMLQVPIGDQLVDVPRGWSAVDLQVRGRTIRFANTHFEAFGFPPLKDQIRNPQAVELAAALEASPYPVILVGDVNVRPSLCKDERLGTSKWPGDQNIVAYETLEDAGLREVWPLLNPKDPCGGAGWTSGQDSIENEASTLDHRIDDVFLSEGFSALRADVVGEEESDRTPSGLWPSDHASTWAKVRLDSANRR
jgi:endonuclease/exonuclease/phosphatase family metal-dependent hydrolase